MRMNIVIDAGVCLLFKILSMLWIALLFISPCAHGNDTTARVGAGGIAFLKNEDIRLLQEDLDISTKSIKVHYRFLNESNADISTIVAFPMPVYGWNPGESAVDANEGPLTSFKVWVDGCEVRTKINRGALIGELDVTEKLRHFGLSEKQIFQTFGDCTIDGCRVSEDQIVNISKLAAEKETFPQWKIAETIYWEQLFPKGKEIEVIHEYSPFVGHSYNYPFQGEWLNDMPVIPLASDKYTASKDSKEACINENTREAVIEKLNAQAKKEAAEVFVWLEDVEYLLGTGRNWKGPIRDFRLRIKKDSADQIIALCFPGKAKEINPLVLEFAQSNYVPQDKLIVYFITADETPEQ